MGKNKISPKGVAFAILAAFLYSSIGVAAKFASETVDSEMMVWCRQFIALLVFLPIFLIDRQRNQVTFLKTSRPRLQILRAVASLTAAYCLFFALAHLPLTNAILLSYTRPLFIPVLVWIIMRKRMEPAIWIGLAVGFIGVLFMLKPGKDVLEIASFVGLAAGVIGAFATLCIRWLAKTQPPNQITLYYFFLSSIFASIPIIWAWKTPPKETLIWLLAIGVLSALYQMCVTRAYRYGRATIIGGVLYTVLIFSGLYEWIIWGKIPDIYTAVGIALICGSSIYTIARTQTRATT